MEGFDLLSAVQPARGWYAVVGINDTNKQQELVDTREELEKWVARFLRRKMNVFFGVAKYKDDSNRTKHNVEALKAFWLDIDCGPTKDYDTQADGLAALRKFCKTVGLPKPIIVNSGRGLHVYWALEEECTREEWEPVAARLKEVCVAQDMRVDPAVFEVARILRIPGTYNFKDDPANEVTVVSVGKPVTLEFMRDTLGVKQRPALLQDGPRQPLSPLGQMLLNSINTRFSKIMQRGEAGCMQLISCYREQADLSEPRWFNALSIAKFCSDRDKAVHKMSAGHPDYDPIKTEQKLKHIVGPHTCAEFEKNNPGVCAGCPHFGKIKSPISLGKELAEAKGKDNVIEQESAAGVPSIYRIPEYPFPYARGKEGGIWRKPMSEAEEAEPILVYPYDFYIVKLMEDPADGGTVLFRLHTPNNGVREFSLTTATVMAPDELRKALAARNIVSVKKKYELLVDYVIRSFENMYETNKVEQMRNQFGWVDNDSKFILGDREISVEGTYHSPPSSATKVLSEHTVPVGSLEKWKEVFNLYGRKGLEASAFAAATAFGAPLLRFSGQRGAIINLVNTHSGTGKTTVLHMCNSVWGNPEKLCAKKDDTFNSKVFKLGVLCNLPVTFDEMSNTEPKQLSELAYLITQGTGKDRMKASANELRVNLTSWQTIALCSSNHSFYEKLEILKNSPQGEMMRIIEYSLDYSDAIDTETGKQMFDHQLLENYGHAGEIYARYLLAEYSKVREIYMGMQARLDEHLKLTQRERFWSATAAANLTGIYIARYLELCDWDIAAIFKWTCKMINNLRTSVAPPPDGDKQILGDFLVGRVDNILIVKDGADRRTKMEELPLLEPRRELMVRYEPDTNKVFVTCASFRQYCASRNIGYRETLNKLKKTGMFLKSGPKRMGKGMKFNPPPVQALEFDATHPDFVSMDGFVPKEEELEGSGG